MVLRRVIFAVAAATVAAGGLAACGSDDGAEAQGPATTGAPACAAPAAPGRTEATIEVDGATRSYLRYVPASYDGTTPVPLVLDLHGSGSDALEQLEGSDMERVADEQGLVVVAPRAGITQSLGSGAASTTGGVWNVPDVVLTDGSAAEPDAPDDVAFLEALVDELRAELCVSTVVATGTSGGGRMSSALGCATDRVDVVAPVAGLRLPEGCAPPGPVEVIAFHGTDDKVNPYGGGGPAYWGAQTVPDAAAGWAALQGCTTGPEEAQVSASVTRTEWTGCEGDVAVTLYTVAGGGHTWPGGRDAAAARPEFAAVVGVTSQEIDAGELLAERAAAAG